MRKAIILITLVAVLAAAALLSGCALTGPGNAVTEGNVVTEEKDFTDFTRVQVEGTFEVEIIRSDSFSIIISADESLFDYVEVSKVGETLRIYLNPRHTFTDFTWQEKTLKAKITMPNLYGLQLLGATTATATGFKSSENFNLDVSGASSLDMDDFEARDVKFEVSGASRVSGNITADDAEFEASGASSVVLEGSANDIILNLSGASKIDLIDLPLSYASINLSGASEATLNVKGRLDAVLSGASRLYFQGNPTMGDISVTGASTIKHK
ncbi:head GIN domain-containing protein [Chloroflexota bacterium]